MGKWCFPIRLQFAFLLKSFGGLFILIKVFVTSTLQVTSYTYLWDYFGWSFEWDLLRSCVWCACVSNLSLPWVLWVFLTVCYMECLCFLGLVHSIECKWFHAGIFVKSVLPPESPASPLYCSPLCSQFLEHHALSGLLGFMRLLCLVIIFLVSAEQPHLSGAPADTGSLVLGSCNSLAVLLRSLWSYSHSYTCESRTDLVLRDTPREAASVLQTEFLSVTKRWISHLYLESMLYWTKSLFKKHKQKQKHWIAVWSGLPQIWHCLVPLLLS